MRNKYTPIQRRSRFGFTLAEIVLTVGILGAALIPILGLIAMSTSSSTDAGSVLVSSSIASEILSDVQQAEQEQIDDWVTGTSFDAYFDYEGFEVTAQADANFTARVKFDDEVGFGFESPAVPGDPPPSGAKHATLVTVDISAAPGIVGEEILDEVEITPLSPRRFRVRSYRTIVTDLGK